MVEIIPIRVSKKAGKSSVKNVPMLVIAPPISDDNSAIKSISKTLFATSCSIINKVYGNTAGT